jgi:hypothetical protein
MYEMGRRSVYWDLGIDSLVYLHDKKKKYNRENKSDKRKTQKE